MLNDTAISVQLPYIAGHSLLNGGFYFFHEVFFSKYEFDPTQFKIQDNKSVINGESLIFSIFTFSHTCIPAQEIYVFYIICVNVQLGVIFIYLQLKIILKNLSLMNKLYFQTFLFLSNNKKGKIQYKSFVYLIQGIKRFSS